MTTRVSLIADDSVKTGTIFNGTVNSEDLNSTAGSQAVTTDTIRDGAVTFSKLQNDASNNTNRAVGTNHIQDKAVTAAKLADDTLPYLSFPLGGIVMWSGTIAQIPLGWYLCDGGTYGGIKTPNLVDRFIVGAGSGYEVGATGGANSVTLDTTQIPSHTHAYAFAQGANGTIGEGYNGISSVVNQGEVAELEQSGRPDGERLAKFTANTAVSGGGQAHENRPPYYALAYIMKCEHRAGQTQTITTTVPTLQELRLNGPLYDQEMDGGAQKGNVGDVLTSLGDGNGVRWESRINLSTEQSFDANGNTFTGIPSWAKRVTIIFDQVSLTTSVDFQVQLNGKNSGYSSSSFITATGNVSTGLSYSTGFGVLSTNAIQNWSGHMILTKMSGNKWISSHVLGCPSSSSVGASHGGGTVTLSSDLSYLSIVPIANQFDNGSFNIMYE